MTTAPAPRDGLLIRSHDAGVSWAMAKPRSPDAQLEGFIAKYSPAIAAQIRDVLARMRARLPGAIELVYDNYNALAIGFDSGEHLADATFSIACYPRWVSLFFFAGVGLDDPQNLLKGAGKRTRHIVLDDTGHAGRPGRRRPDETGPQEIVASH